MSLRWPLSTAASSCLCLLLGCTSAHEPTTSALPDGGNSDAQVGGFVVSLVAAVPATGDSAATPAYTSVLGKVYDGPVPSPVVWTAVAEAGGCTLLTPRVPFCATACTGGAACAADDTCAPYPAAKNVGTVQVLGLAGGAFSMEPIGGSYQPAADVRLPSPPCAEGAEIRVETKAGAFGAFAIASRGIAPLELVGAVELLPERPLALAWAGRSDFTRVEVKLDLSHHGGSKGRIDCDVPDTGALEIPAPLIAKLVALGLAGFPTVVVTRVASGAAAIPPGRVSLRIASTVEREVLIPGLESCTGDADCPRGKSCQSDLTCK